MLTCNHPVIANNKVNKTALHPGGIEPHQEEHTELEIELHDKAHIDYDRVAIVRLEQVLHRY